MAEIVENKLENEERLIINPQKGPRLEVFSTT